jgi:hypothetical protein
MEATQQAGEPARTQITDLAPSALTEVISTKFM